MADLKLEWTVVSKPMFEFWKNKLISTEHYAVFVRVHNEVLSELRNLDRALEKGELLYKTRKQGGYVCHWVHQFISICYVVFPKEKIVWILRYHCVPETWPDLR